MLEKNIIILGASRSGKTTLARKLSKEYGYNLISLDDIICAFENIPECGIKHDGDDIEVARNFAPFLIRYLKELSEGTNYYNGIKYVIEGTHIDFEQLMPFLNKEKYELEQDLNNVKLEVEDTLLKAENQMYLDKQEQHEKEEVKKEEENLGKGNI